MSFSEKTQYVLSQHEELVRFGMHCKLEVVDVIEDVCGCWPCDWISGRIAGGMVV